ncbi:MAG: response regulator transcription factor [Bryobacteraceae bacterium]|nr:response regulator transcription factor [Bryobacteraceae bacterium]
MIRVLIVAASGLTRAGLEALLRADDSIVVVAGVDSPAAVAASVVEHGPDVIVASTLDEPPEELMEAAASPDAPAVILLLAGPGADAARETIRTGVRGVLPAEPTAAELGAAVRAAAAGLIVLHPQEVDALTPVESPAASSLPAETLTSREIEVLRMLADGHANKSIAWRLGISEHTAKFHVASIMGKLRAGSRTEAVAIGLRRGLIPI